MIKNDQVFISIVRRGCNENNFNFNYQNRDNTVMFEDLGLTLEKVAKHVPGGILIFFPPYWLMEKTYEIWTNSGVLDKI